ncbi:Zinc finger, ring/fyve/phd-type [Globisporangium polare]
MKAVNTHTWQHSEAAAQCAGSTSFAHLLCSRWDPHSLYAVDSGGSTQSTITEEEPRDAEAKSTTTETAGKDIAPESTSNADAPAELVVQEYDFALDLPGPCCFCASSCGARIKCQHLDCGLFFHVMCAHERNGHVEIRSPQSPLAQHHAYCARHHDSSASFDASALLEKLLSKSIGALTGRDVTLKFETIRRRLEPPSDSNKSPFYTSINAFFSAVATVLVDLCKKGVRGSKADPPVPNLRHLQALQFFLDHVPQLQVVYRAPREPVQQLVLQAGGDSELVALLLKTFNPQRYFGKYAGPVSQVHVCHVCAEPFHERQHLFYCSHETTPHLQHWKCTKRRSNSREREKIAVAAVAAITGGSGGKKAASSNANSNSVTSITSSIGSKKKLKSISLVVNGQLREVMLPKGLPGVSDEIICGVCRSDVDAHGLIGSRKEGKRADFEKKKSNFVHGGCFMNPVDGSRPSAGGVSRLAGSASAARPPIAPVKVESTKASSKDRSRGSKRSASAMESSKSSNGPAAAALEVSSAVAASAAPVLGPPKMERINVQRTTKWLAYVAQIIRLAGTVAKLSSEAGAASSSSAAVSTEAVEDVVKEEDSGARQEKKPSDTTSLDATVAELALMRAEDRVQHGGKTSDDASSVTTDTPAVAQAVNEPPRKPDVHSEIVRLSQAIDAYFDEAIQIVRPFDAYVVSKLETARGYLRNRSGPAVGVLRMIAQEYTRFVYVKHTRAVEKASNEKRKREEQAVQELRDQERKRLEREAELALKSQMLAMRKKQRKLVKMG